MREEYREITYRDDLSNYMVSNIGNVYNKATKSVLKGYVGKSGYKTYTLRKDDGKLSTFPVHMMVAKIFIPNPENKPFVNHKDENRMNTCVGNLEWVTHRENINYGTAQKRRISHAKKPVNEYDLMGNYIRTWKSVDDVSKFVSDRYQRETKTSHIQKCCTKKQKTALCRQWRYYDGNTDNIGEVQYARVGGYNRADSLSFKYIDNVPEEYLLIERTTEELIAELRAINGLSLHEIRVIDELEIKIKDLEESKIVKHPMSHGTAAELIFFRRAI